MSRNDGTRYFDNENPPPRQSQPRRSRGSGGQSFLQLFGDRGSWANEGSRRHSNNYRRGNNYGYNDGYSRDNRPPFRGSGRGRGQFRGYDGSRNYRRRHSADDGRPSFAKLRDGRPSRNMEDIAVEEDRDGIGGRFRADNGSRGDSSSAGVYEGRLRPERQSSDDGNPSSRKKRRFVPGGAIAKYKKEIEFTGSLYCQVCDDYFYDVNAKGMHDRSKEHRKAFAHLRQKEEMVGDQINKEAYEEEDVMNVVSDDKNCVPDPDRVAKKAVAKVKEANFSNAPIPFRNWASRSLENAAKVAKQENNPSIAVSVQKEVLEVLQHHTEHCTLRQVSWDRRPLASGPAFRVSRKTIPSNARTEPTNMVSVPQNPVQANVATRVPSDEITSVDTKPPTNEPVRRYWEQKEPPANAEKRKSLEPKPKRTGPFVCVPEVDVKVETAHVEYKVKAVRWRLSPKAADVFYANQVEDRKSLLYNYNARFRSLTEKIQAQNEKESGLDSISTPVGPLLEKCNSLFKDYHSGDYEYIVLKNGLSHVIESLRKRGTRFGTMQRCLQIKIYAAIRACEFQDCFEPCSELIKIYQWYRGGEELRYECIGHWFISLLFKMRVSKSNRRMGKGSSILMINSQMRELPVGSLDDNLVYMAVNVFQAVITNNWVQFFTQMDNILHVKTEGRSKGIMEGLNNFVRERALVTMLRMGRFSEATTYFPKSLPFDFVRRTLGWRESSSDEDGIDLEDACEFINGLPQKFVMLGHSSNSQGMAVKSKDENVGIQDSCDVEAGALLKYSGNACSLIPYP